MDRYARRVLSLGCSLVVALAVGCAGDDGEGDDAGAPKIAEFEEECTQIFSCDCEDHGWAEVESCAETFAVYYAGIEAAAAAAGLNVDLACVKSELPYASAQCLTSTEYDNLERECSYCQYASGDRGIGEPCVRYVFGMSDCAQGLRCYGSGIGKTCIDPCERRGLDELCGDPQACEEGLYCSNIDKRCHAYAEEGQSCGMGRCAEGLHCHWENETCQAFRGAGENCGSGDRCAEGLDCDWETGTCVNLPGLGEDCSAGRGCASGLRCDQDTSTCVSRPGLGEPCMGPCAAPFLCDYGAEICVIEEPLICY